MFGRGSRVAAARRRRVEARTLIAVRQRGLKLPRIVVTIIE
jgi:hypothetical protein